MKGIKRNWEKEKTFYTKNLETETLYLERVDVRQGYFYKNETDVLYCQMSMLKRGG